MKDLERIFNDSQIQVIKEIIRHDKADYVNYVFSDDLEWSGKLSGISKAIKASRTDLVAMDFLDDRKPVIIFNLDKLNHNELTEWAKTL